MKRSLLVVTIICAVACISCSTAYYSGNKRDLSPLKFGLAKARNGVERYNVLYETHKAAVTAGVNVDYSGIKTVSIEIPEKAKPIPLTRYNDFKGCVFVVKNTTHKVWLFVYEEKGTPIDLSGKTIDAGDFRKVSQLNNGRYLLVIRDKNPWVNNRKGYKYGHQRKDILLIENGKAMNTVVKPYGNAESSPNCTYIKQGNAPFVIKNVTIRREAGSTFVTNIASIAGLDDVRLTNVSIYTPQSSLTDDRALTINNCTNATFDNVHIDGTYSQTDHSGYGVFMNNIWNFKAIRMYGKGNWGIFGNNNINTALIENSKINRFDIHCYGRDISFKNVEFFDRYNQYSSVFGTISHDHCKFTSFVPVLNGGSYNSFVGHEIVFTDCVFNVTAKKNYLIKLSNLGTDVNERKEISAKALPNVRIKNMKVNMTEGADYLYLFYTNASAKNVGRIDYLSNITIDGMMVVEDENKPFKGMALNNVQLKTAKPVECTIQNVEVRQAGMAMKSSSAGAKLAVLKANMPLKGGKAEMKNVRGMKQ